MAALSDNKDTFEQRPDLARQRILNVAASTTIYRGGIVVIDGSGNAINAPATAANIFIGIAMNYVTNAAVSATTDFPLVTRAGHIEQMSIAAATIADVGKAVFYTTSGDVSFTRVAVTGFKGSQVGTVHSIVSSTIILVDTSKQYTFSDSATV